MNEPRLMGVSEIRERLALTRNEVVNLVRRKGFPAPADQLLGGRIWMAGDVEAWIREHRPDQASPEE